MTIQAYRSPAQSSIDPSRLYEVNAAAADFYASRLAAHQPVIDYLSARGISAAAASGSGWQLGYAPSGWRDLVNHLAEQRFSLEEIYAAGLATFSRYGELIDRFRDRLVFPIHDHTGQVAGFTGRDLSEGGDAPKWLNTPETRIYTKSRLLYGLGPQLQQHQPDGQPPLVIIVEGAADAIAVWRMSQSIATLPDAIPIVAVAPCGTTLADQQLQLLRDTLPAGSRLAVALDGDPAGRAGFLRAYPLLRSWPGRTYAITLPAGYDPAQLAGEHGPAAGLAELAKRLTPAARTALAFTIDRLIEQGRIVRPREWVEDRLAAYAAIADFFVDDPIDVPGLAQAAADRFGLEPGEVVRGVVEHVFPTELGDLVDTTAESDPAASIGLQQPQPDPPRSPLGDRQVVEKPSPGSEPDADPAQVGQDSEQLDTVSWAQARRPARWPVTDATHAAIDMTSGRWAWALAHGIGDRPDAAAAADTAARVAAQIAARATPAAGITAAGAALHDDSTIDDSDAEITVATAYPTETGTTRVEIAWSGSIRAYARLGDRVIQLTTDHTVAQQRIEAGQPVSAGSQLHHLLTSSARQGPVGRASITLPPGGSLLLCTAGAHRNLDDAALRRALNSVRDPQATIDRLQRRITGSDNAVVMLLRAPGRATAGGQAAQLARLASSAACSNTNLSSAPAASVTELIGQLRNLLGGRQLPTRTGVRR